MTLIEAARKALAVAEGFIDHEYEGTDQYDALMANLEPVREAIRHAERAEYGDEYPVDANGFMALVPGSVTRNGNPI